MRLVVTAVLAVLALVGCDRSEDGGTGTPSPPGEPGRLQAYVTCLREHGVTVADPAPGEDLIRIEGGSATEAEIQAAREACRQYEPTGGPGSSRERVPGPPPTGSRP